MVQLNAAVVSLLHGKIVERESADKVVNRRTAAFQCRMEREGSVAQCFGDMHIVQIQSVGINAGIYGYFAFLFEELANVSHRSVDADFAVRVVDRGFSAEYIVGIFAVRVVDRGFSAEYIVGIFAVYGNVAIGIAVVVEPWHDTLGVDVAQVGGGFHLNIGGNGAKLCRGKNVANGETLRVQFGFYVPSTEREVYVGIAVHKSECALCVVVAVRSLNFAFETKVAQAQNFGGQVQSESLVYLLDKAVFHLNDLCVDVPSRLCGKVCERPFEGRHDVALAVTQRKRVQFQIVSCSRNVGVEVQFMVESL